MRLIRRPAPRPHGYGPGLDPNKHESPRDRDQRHAKAVADAREPQGSRSFSVTDWDAMHRAAEDATLMFHAGEN